MGLELGDVNGFRDGVCCVATALCAISPNRLLAVGLGAEQFGHVPDRCALGLDLPPWRLGRRVPP
jgi:hypothetical protein